MGISFNLIDQPWIPAVMADAAPCELSLAQTFARAYQVREIFDQSPLATVALHRLLLAILHRCFGPSGASQWGRLWRDGWDPAVLGAYFSRWRERFDLFDPKRPFFQVPEMEDTQSKPVATLLEESAAGNNATLFDHSFADEPRSLGYAAAARGLIARQAFSLGFGKSAPFYFSDSTLIRGYSLLLYGANLFETLMLNLMGYGPKLPIRGSGRGPDLPAWEQRHPASPAKAGTAPLGYLDYLTWQSRRIHLYPEPDGSGVRWCQLRQNLKLSKAASAQDPFKCYRHDEERGTVARSFRDERGLWRDSPALLGGRPDSSSRPKVIDWLATLCAGPESNLLPRTAELSAFGLATAAGKSASVTFWRHARLPLPLALVREPKLLETMSLAVGCAQDAARELGLAAWTFARTRLEPPINRNLAESARLRTEDLAPVIGGLAVQRRYWRVLDAEFAGWMSELATAAPAARDAHLMDWRGRVRRAAGAALNAALRERGLSARALRAATIAERLLAVRLGGPGARAPGAAAPNPGASSLALVEFLEQLHEKGNWDTLGILRAAGGKSARAAREALRVRRALLAAAPQRRNKDDGLLVASLFAIHPLRWPRALGEPRPRYNFGSSMSTLRLRRPEDSDRVERRFAALLDASRAELGAQLRDTVKRFAVYNVRVDWAQLLDDLEGWEVEGRRVQRRWARAFWAGARAAAATETPADQSGAEQGDP